MKNSLTGKILSIVLAVTVIFGALPVFAVPSFAASTSDLTFELNDYGDGYIVSDCNTSASGELVIPSEYNGLPVTGIGDGAFDNCTSLESVIIPGSVDTIGNNAFLDCVALNSVTIPDSVEYIFNRAFFGCTSLKSVTVPATTSFIAGDALGYDDDSHHLIEGFVINGYKYSVAYDYAAANGIKFNAIGELDPIKFKLNYMGTSYVLVSCSTEYAVGDFVIPSKYNGLPVTEIDQSAFLNCKKLTSVTIPEGVTDVGYYAFYGCSKLKSVTIPDSVEMIGSRAFGYADEYYDWDKNEWIYPKIEGFVINGYTYSKAQKYATDNGLSFNAIGEGIPVKYAYDSYLETYTLVACSDLYAKGEFVVPSTYNGAPVTSIGRKAFYDCKELTSVVISDSVFDISAEAFYGCTALESVKIGSGVESIGNSTFVGCEKLEEITVPTNVRFFGDYFYGYYYDEENCEFIKYNDFKINGYTYSKVQEYANQNGITFNSLGEASPIVYYNQAEWSNAPFSVLEYCSPFYNAGELVIPKMNGKFPVQEIGYSAFENCVNLTSVTFPEGLRYIDPYAFDNCENLKTVNFSNTITGIWQSAFLNCTSLKSVTIPDSVTEIGDYAFGYVTDEDTWEYVRSDSDFTIYGYPNSAAEKYAIENGIDFVAIGSKVSDEESGISVAGGIPEGAVLNIKTLEETEDGIIFDITITSGGVAVQPDGAVTVRIPVPETLFGEDCKVYRKEANGSYTDMNAVFDGFNLIFTTNHFSEYVVTEGDLSVVYGDANGDGKVDLKDVVLLRQYMANYVYATGTSSVAVKPGADANGDGKVDLKDVVLLRQYMANYSYDTESSTVVLGPR